MNITQITTDKVFITLKNTTLKILIKDYENRLNNIQFNLKNAVIIDPSNFHIIYYSEEKPDEANILWITDDPYFSLKINFLTYMDYTIGDLLMLSLPVVHFCEQNHWHNYYSGERISDTVVGHNLMESLNKTNKETD